MTLCLFIAAGCASAPPATLPATISLSVRPTPAIAVSTQAPVVSPLATSSPRATVPLSSSVAVATTATTPTMIVPAETHTTLPSGLTVDEYALQGPPTLDPLNFTPLRLTQPDIVARHRKDGGQFVASNFGMDALGGNISTEWHGQTLTAREIFTDSTTGVVNVLLAQQVIFTLPIGPGGPIDNLRRLFNYDGHWLLEVADVTRGTDPITHDNVVTTAGQIVEDGLILNARHGYQSAFGLQLLRGKLFYFYQQAGQIGIVYDGHRTPLGYDAVPHYGCCSGAELNPKPRENMVSFFAQKGGGWFYVEIGNFLP